MKKSTIVLISIFMAIIVLFSCNNSDNKNKTNLKMKSSKITAKELLGNPNYLAMSYGGYRHKDHSIEPTMQELKDDLKLLHAMGIRFLRTYKVHKPQAANLVKAISELKKEDISFEMYVMLGIWIDCKNAWTEWQPIHNEESNRNAVEVEAAVKLANEYPDVIKVLAVGNEAMVKWATAYYVEPWIILKWVNHLQQLKANGKLDKDLWITSSDNFASWGGGEDQYHVKDLNKLIKAVDYLSIHTYPMHDTHYNPMFWGVTEKEAELSEAKKIELAMYRAQEYAKSQYKGVENYMKSLGVDKPIHIGETGWASVSNGFYGPNGSKACDEYKEAIFYKSMRQWTNAQGISCFYFEAFNEPWKDAQNDNGSENHFGLFTVNGKAKYAIWDLVDKGVFKDLTRNGNSITKTYNGNKESLMKDVVIPTKTLQVVE